MSAVPALDLRARHRAATIIAVALIAAVGVNGLVIELIARLGLMKEYPMAGQAWLAYALLAVGVVVVGTAARARRAALERGAADPGARIQTASIIALALAEVPATFALVVFVSTGARGGAYPLLVLSLLAHAVFVPRWSQWEEWAREIRSQPSAPTR